MRPPHRILNRNQVHRLAAEHLQAHLKFQDYKRKTSARLLPFRKPLVSGSYQQIGPPCW
jgi:hypothetical protein